MPGYIVHLLGGTGLTRGGRRIAQVVFGAGALALLVYAWRRRNWLAAGSGALALLVATLGWLLPWYAVWALALAPLARKRWVPVAAIGLTAVVLAIEIHVYNEHRVPEPTPGAVVGGHTVGVPGPQIVPGGALATADCYTAAAGVTPNASATPRGTTSTGAPDVSIA